MAVSMGAMSFFGNGLAVWAAEGGARIMDVTSSSSDGVGHRDALLVDNGAAVAAFKDAGFKDI
jgi:hypothetical protein